MSLRQEQKNEKLGETRKNKESLGGCEMKIIKYNRYKDITVEFQDKHKAKIHTTYQHFEKGDVKNPYYPSVYGVGYIGEGKYKVKEKTAGEGYTFLNNTTNYLDYKYKIMCLIE